MPSFSDHVLCVCCQPFKHCDPKAILNLPGHTFILQVYGRLGNDQSAWTVACLADRVGHSTSSARLALQHSETEPRVLYMYQAC